MKALRVVAVEHLVGEAEQVTQNVMVFSEEVEDTRELQQGNAS